MARAVAIAAHDVRVLRRDPMSIVVLTVMPLVLMGFVKPAYRLTLAGEGRAVNGAEQAVPGMAVLFAFYMLGYLGLILVREHGWNTWVRLRATEASAAEIIGGKTICPLVLSIGQLAVLFLVGGLVFDLDLRGSLLGLAAVVTALAVSIVALAFALVSVFDSIMKVNAVGNLLALLFAGLGGALSPVDALPGWAAAVAPATPSYWAMRGFRQAFLHGTGLGPMLGSAGVLLLFAAVFATVAARRFRLDDVKVSFA